MPRTGLKRSEKSRNISCSRTHGRNIVVDRGVEASLSAALLPPEHESSARTGVVRSSDSHPYSSFLFPAVCNVLAVSVAPAVSAGCQIRTPTPSLATTVLPSIAAIGMRRAAVVRSKRHMYIILHPSSIIQNHQSSDTGAPRNPSTLKTVVVPETIKEYIRMILKAAPQRYWLRLSGLLPRGRQSSMLMDVQRSEFRPGLQGDFACPIIRHRCHGLIVAEEIFAMRMQDFRRQRGLSGVEMIVY
ncbi:hypothetical protein C8Q74DRAFT_1219041 [Fomes fomentarius]|nr:hypothetical protein C8Q74DRAFT_1219041 [Fomes fomentarius]